MDQARRSFHELACSALESVARGGIQGGAQGPALDAAKRLVALEPLHEEGAPDSGRAPAARLSELRDSISEVDRSLLELLHRRMQLAAEVGKVKVGQGQPIMVPEVHHRVLTRARQHADACGVSEEVMESIFKAVMRGSIERQHRIGVEVRAEGGSRLLVLGGAGDMGRWFQSFAHLLGHRIDVVDPAMAPLPKAPGRSAALEDVPDLGARTPGDDAAACWAWFEEHVLRQLPWLRWERDGEDSRGAESTCPA